MCVGVSELCCVGSVWSSGLDNRGCTWMFIWGAVSELGSAHGCGCGYFYLCERCGSRWPFRHKGGFVFTTTGIEDGLISKVSACTLIRSLRSCWCGWCAQVSGMCWEATHGDVVLVVWGNVLTHCWEWFAPRGNVRSRWGSWRACQCSCFVQSSEVLYVLMIPFDSCGRLLLVLAQKFRLFCRFLT